MLAMTCAGGGVDGPDPVFDLQLFDAQGEKVWSESLTDAERQLENLLQEATGRQSAEFYRETLLVLLDTGMPAHFLAGAGYNLFAARRRQVLRELGAS